MGQIIPFPARPATSAPMGRLPAGSSRLEEATFHVRLLRAERDTSDHTERRHHLAIIGLRWWEGELFRLLGKSASTATLMEAH